jgi:hypothetical protein
VCVCTLALAIGVAEGLIGLGAETLKRISGR